jgi:periplasmic divalent cation tolerance protein
MTGNVLAITTTATEAEGKKIARELVESQLAACVNVIPGVRSIYRWEGRVEEAEEFLLVIKTTRPLTEEVRQAIAEMHSYELPEFVVLPIEAGSPEYLRWITDSVLKV